MKKILLFAGLLLAIGNVSGQNNYPTEKNGVIKLDGGYIDMIMPETSGGWARGFLNYDLSMNRLGGVGLYGSQTNSSHYYMAHGVSPWISGLGLYVITNGNVGIGTTSPDAKLEIYGGGNLLLRGANNDAGDLVFETKAKVQTGRIWTANQGASGMYLSSGDNAPDISINSIGNVGIGISNPYYKLDVAGTIRAHEIKVNLNTDGADFVFNSDYALRSLQEVEAFVTENNHLPEIASAKEMEENGLNMAEFQIQLLQKVEELTLYMIEMHKQINEKDSAIEALNNKVEQLEQTKQ